MAFIWPTYVSKRIGLGKVLSKIFVKLVKKISCLFNPDGMTLKIVLFYFYLYIYPPIISIFKT